jgi:hypothetical protein
MCPTGCLGRWRASGWSGPQCLSGSKPAMICCMRAAAEGVVSTRRLFSAKKTFASAIHSAQCWADPVPITPMVIVSDARVWLCPAAEASITVNASWTQRRGRVQPKCNNPPPRVHKAPEPSRSMENIALVRLWGAGRSRNLSVRFYRIGEGGLSCSQLELVGPNSGGGFSGSAMFAIKALRAGVKRNV